MGLLGLGSLWHKESLIPAAIVGGLYYGLAGLGHVPRPHKNAKESYRDDLGWFRILGAVGVHSIRRVKAPELQGS
jgi:hypothetical protein